MAIGKWTKLIRGGLVACALVFSADVTYSQTTAFILNGVGRCIASPSGSTYMVLQNSDWKNNAGITGFMPGNSTVIFSGSAVNNAITGTAVSDSTSFTNLRIDKSTKELQLGRTVSVNGLCSLANGNLNLLDARMNLSSTGSVSGEGASKRIYCPDNSTGHVRAARSLGAGTNDDIAGLGLSLNVTSGVAPGNTVMLRGHDRQTSTSTGFTGIGRYYDIYPTVTSGYTYTFVFKYQDAELASIPEQNMTFYRSASHAANPSDWQELGIGSAVHSTADNTVTLSGLTSFSRWTVSNFSVAPLPVELGNFNAECTDNEVILRWITLSEINNDSFRVERSKNLQTWESVGAMSGSGNNNAPLHYALVDERPFNGLSYYRLTQTDYDGQSETFAPVAVNCSFNLSEYSFSVYPNPSTGLFALEIPNFPNMEDARLLIHDMQGKPLLVQILPSSSGSQPYYFDLTGFSAGMYTLQIKSNGFAGKPVKLILQ